MKKIVINTCYGGFGLSKKGCEMYAGHKGLELGNWNYTWGFYEGAQFYDREIPRDDPFLVQMVEHLGKEVSGKYSELRIVEVPDDVEWTIEEYDGKEWVSEVHRTWS